MSKRKGSSINRQSKRHKGNDYYNDGKTQLQREMEALEAYDKDMERREFDTVQQGLQDPNNQMGNQGTGGIVAGDTSDESADEDRVSLGSDGDEDYQQGIYSKFTSIQH